MDTKETIILVGMKLTNGNVVEEDMTFSDIIMVLKRCLDYIEGVKKREEQQDD